MVVPAPFPLYLSTLAPRPLTILNISLPRLLLRCSFHACKPRLDSPIAPFIVERAARPAAVPARAATATSRAVSAALRALPLFHLSIFRLLYLPALPTPLPCVRAELTPDEIPLSVLPILLAACDITIMSRTSPIRLPVVFVTVAPNWDIIPSKAMAPFMNPYVTNMHDNAPIRSF